MGLSWIGTIGNPTQLTLSAINLKIAAAPFLYQVKDKIEKDAFWMFSGEFGDRLGSNHDQLLASGQNRDVFTDDSKREANERRFSAHCEFRKRAVLLWVLSRIVCQRNDHQGLT